VTVFGSARVPEDNAHYQLAREMGAAIARLGFTVMTGGGPGIMEAAIRVELLGHVSQTAANDAGVSCDQHGGAQYNQVFHTFLLCDKDRIPAEKPLFVVCFFLCKNCARRRADSTFAARPA
jgi:hypothetical protein